MDDQLAATRKINFGLLRYLRGRHEKLVEELRYVANSNQVSDFAMGKRPISDNQARVIEERLKLSAGWLDRDHSAYLNASADTQQVLVLIAAAPDVLREAVKTMLEHTALDRPARALRIVK